MNPEFRVSVNPHTQRVLPWSQTRRAGSREDRTLREISVSYPPKIAGFLPTLSSSLSATSDAAIATIARLDEVHGTHLSALSLLLLRAESVASSKIEHIEADVEDFARAAHGVKSNSSATSMVASAAAITHLISTVTGHQEITLENLLAAHRVLMADDPHEWQYAGRLRDVQNWVGGSDYSPRNALFIPPPAAEVEMYMRDLLDFANRDDIPVLTQAAVAHAQFESIHPFTDGNGRIGRALINTILRRRGATSEIVLPIASALVTKQETYFDVLNTYRNGDAGPIIRALSLSAQTVAREAQSTAELLASLPELWMEAYAQTHGKPPRAGSAPREVLGQLLNLGFFTAEELHAKLGGGAARIYNAIGNLADAGILHPLTTRTRNQIWCAQAILAELEDLGARVAHATAQDTNWRAIRAQLHAAD